ncbi:Nascent polypeptide-associated complex subunit alpha Short=NAC-alpha [Rhizoctonia solani AG-1 IB]|uniref:Nascent polypeptide-associated complex subunit alpha n=1 Tax=Thanatephorus cucumeris (strain AG1-IB / isolate 7/3/14) TaxID=1108050 RepID=M5C8P9_THACB|nr:Nascent polypeptide-associated complex subunit alpha Short=NAC-alpha [Rhizoctonia solani AG-1 IB]
MSAHIEEVSDHEGHDHGHEGHDHDHDHDHAHDVELDPTSNAALEKIQSRPERKARKALISLGLKKVPGITRILLVVANPEVFKSPSSDIYIVFGEAKTEDIAAAQQAAAAAAAAAAAEREGQEPTGQEDTDETPKTLEDLAGDAPGATGKAPEAVDEEEEVDETGVDPKDIELVIQQVGCSRAKAVRVLKESGGDLINAIMAANE